MVYILMLALWVGMSSGQLKVNDEAALTADQRAVLPLLQQLRTAVLQRNASRLIELFESTGTRLTIEEVRNINVFERRIEDPKDLISCVIFDTECARAYFKQTPAEAAQKISLVFISVKEFLENNEGALQVSFHEQPRDQVLAEIHIPRRPDSSTVPPPLGQYESVSLHFTRTRSGWKINSLFPEPYAIVLEQR